MNGGVIELSERTLVESEPCYGGADKGKNSTRTSLRRDRRGVLVFKLPRRSKFFLCVRKLVKHGAKVLVTHQTVTVATRES